jgi:RNA polymerase sigma-32 factor
MIELIRRKKGLKKMDDFKDIKDLPLLTAKREHELGTIIRKNESQFKKDLALIELIESNLKLAAKEAIRYSKVSKASVEELYNGGRVGLIRAANDYDPEQYNTRFSTYATIWIRRGIRDVVYGESPVTVPVNVINGLYRKNKAIGVNKNISNADLKKEINVTDAQLDAINKANVTSISLNMTLDNDSKGENISTLADLIEDEKAVIPGESHMVDPRYDFLEDAMSELDEVSREILHAQIMADEKVYLHTLAQKHGITSERVRQIKAKALLILKKKIVCKMSSKGYKPTKEMLKNLAPKKKNKKLDLRSY